MITTLFVIVWFVSVATNVVDVFAPKLGKSNLFVPPAVETVPTLKNTLFPDDWSSSKNNWLSLKTDGPSTVKKPLPCGSISTFEFALAVSLPAMVSVDEPSWFAERE